MIEVEMRLLLKSYYLYDITKTASNSKGNIFIFLLIAQIILVVRHKCNNSIIEDVSML